MLYLHHNHLGASQNVVYRIPCKLPAFKGKLWVTSGWFKTSLFSDKAIFGIPVDRYHWMTNQHWAPRWWSVISHSNFKEKKQRNLKAAFFQVHPVNLGVEHLQISSPSKVIYMLVAALNPCLCLADFWNWSGNPDSLVLRNLRITFDGHSCTILYPIFDGEVSIRWIQSSGVWSCWFGAKHLPTFSFHLAWLPCF